MNKKMLRRLAAVALLVAGLMAIWNVDNSKGTHCGSWISPNTAAAGMADAKANSATAQRNLEDAYLREAVGQGGSSSESSSTAQVDSCRDSRSARTPLIIGAAVVGFALLGFAATRS